MTHPVVAVLMGSKNDLPIMETTLKCLEKLDIHFEAHILSAHRSPQATIEYISSADKRGCQVFIAAAGLAAHLAGMVAAHTIRPVIGVPLAAGTLGGIDALLSTVQMPGGMPVACTAIGKAGAHNAALLAAQILAVNNPALANKLMALREEKREELKQADKQLQQTYELTTDILE